MCKLRSIRVIAVFEDGSRSNHEYHGNPHLTAAQIRQRIDDIQFAAIRLRKWHGESPLSYIMTEPSFGHLDALGSQRPAEWGAG